LRSSPNENTSDHLNWNMVETLNTLHITSLVSVDSLWQLSPCPQQTSLINAHLKQQWRIRNF